MSRCGSYPIYDSTEYGVYCPGDYGVEECADKLQDLYYAMSDEIKKQKISTLPNVPLTLEELREMDGKPVWCINGNGGQWGLVHVFSAEGRTCIECVTKTGFTMDKMTYGAMGIYAWLAYRRKPEEAKGHGD